MPKCLIPIPPTPLVDAAAWRYRVIFDHGAEIVITLSLSRPATDPDHVVGEIELISDTRVQETIREH